MPGYVQKLAIYLQFKINHFLIYVVWTKVLVILFKYNADV